MALARDLLNLPQMGTPNLSPISLIRAIDMLAEGKAAIFIDSHHCALCNKEEAYLCRC
jgi:hypothetical protein